MSDKLDDFGYAVDVGANDGLNLSNTKWLEDKGWYVLCVEPNPFLVEAGRKNRRLWRQVAAGDYDGLSEFHIAGVYPHDGWSGVRLVEGGPNISPESWAHVKEHATLCTVPIARLDTILETSGFPNIDALFMDVEGFEMTALAGLNLKRWTPAIVVVEAWNPENEETLKTYMDSQGYAFQEKFEFDCLFLKRA